MFNLYKTIVLSCTEFTISTPLRYIIPIMDSGEAANYNLIVLGLIRQGLEPAKCTQGMHTNHYM
jgi:hypothetical protein